MIGFRVYWSGVGCWAEYWGLVLDGVPVRVRCGEGSVSCRLFDGVSELVGRALGECRVVRRVVERAYSGEGGEVEGIRTIYSIYGCHHVAARLWRLAAEGAAGCVDRERPLRLDFEAAKLDALLWLEPCRGTLEEVFGCLRERFSRLGHRVARVWASSVGGEPVDDPEMAWNVVVETVDGRRFSCFLRRHGTLIVNSVHL